MYIKKNKEKITFHIKYVMILFGLCNAPGIFQFYINKTFWELPDSFCTVYLDDILIFSESISAHIKYFQQVL